MAFCPLYATLQVPESVWFSKMKPEAKEKHLKKVQTCQVEQGLELKAAMEHASVKQQHNTFLSVSVENAGLSSILYSTLTSIVEKSREPDSVCGT